MKPWPAVVLLFGAWPSDVDTVGMRNGAEGGKQIPRVLCIVQSWLPAAGLQPAERGAERCSPHLAGMCWHDEIATGGERGPQPPAATDTGLFTCPLSLTLKLHFFSVYLTYFRASSLTLLSASSLSPPFVLSPLCDSFFL